MALAGETRLGLTIPLSNGLDDPGHLAALCDQGYTDFWTSETSRFDAFIPLAAAAFSLPTAWLGTAIASVFARGPATLAMSAAALAACAPGRFLLGIGASSPVLTRDWNATEYERPLGRVRDTARFLRSALRGDTVDEQYETFAVRRFTLEQPPAVAPPVLVAGLRPAALRVAAQEADGAILNWLSPQDVRTSRAVLGDDALVAARIFVCCSESVDDVRNAARRLIAGYLTVPGYAAYHRWLGRESELTPMWQAWAAGDRKAAAASVPDEVVDDLIVHGSVEACAEQIARYREAGVDIPIVKLLPLDPSRDLAADAAALAMHYRAGG